jgi:CheY-like chemotaxis protein
VCGDGQQLLDTLEVIAPMMPDMIFLDINMPVKNGFETLVDIRKLHSDKIPVFFLLRCKMPLKMQGGGEQPVICRNHLLFKV